MTAEIMNEPDFIAQCADPMTQEQRLAWIERQARASGENGGTFARCTVHDEIPDLILFEGWKVRPDDQGEPRFQFSPTLTG